MKLPKGMFQRGRSFYVRQRKDGKDRWVSLGRNYGEAKRRLRDLRLGQAPKPRITVSAAAERWLGSYIENTRMPRQRKIARARVRRYLGPRLGGRMLSEVRADDLRGYRLWLEGQGLAPQTVCNVLSDARCMFHWALDSGLVEASPVPRKLLPRLQERPPDRLTGEEVNVLTGLPEPYGFVLRLGLGTGLRWSELCRALASDVEQGSLVLSQTKSGKVRRVPLPPCLLSEVRRRIGRLVPFDGRQPSAFSRVIRKLSGVSMFHTHQMRHTFACQWLEAGGSLPALQQILGHASVATTQRYGRLSDEAVREQAERVWRG